MAKQTITLEELYDAGAHYGHQARRWNPRMQQYLYGTEEGVHIFDLEKTREALVNAMEVVSDAIKAGKSILLVGTKKQIKDKVAELGHKANILYINERWLGGTLTNFEQIRKSVTKMAEMKDKLERGEYASFTKKERLLIERKIADLEKSLGGLAGIKKHPDLLVIIDTHKEYGALKEANMLKIPVVGIVDSNADPSEVSYPIPMNDDATKSLEFFMKVLENAILGEPKEVLETTKRPRATRKKKDEDNS